MKINCNKCGHIIDRDTKIEGQVVEEYKNIYGTYCSKCGTFNKSCIESTSIEKKRNTLEFLREQVRDILRDQIRRQKW